MTEAARLEEIYREYRPNVQSYLRSHVTDPEDAEDLCSEIFRKVLEHLDPAAGMAVSSYIYTITKRTVVDYYRTRRATVPLDGVILAGDDPEEGLLERDMLGRLARTLEQLDERQRDVVVLHYSAGCSLQEISRRMELPYGVVKRIHQAALQALRLRLDGAN